MSSNVQLILLSIVGFVVLVTFVLSMRVRQKHHKLYPTKNQTPSLGIPQTSDEFGIIPINRKAADKTENNENIQAYSELGFNELGDIFSETTAQSQSTPVVTDNATKQNRHTSLKSSGLVVLYLMTKPGQKFVGYELLQALLAAGLRFGEMSIFHRYQQPNGHGLALFSLASATEPGIFDMNKMGAFSCQGLTLFMNLTGEEHNLKALEIMLTCAQQLADDLHAVVLDERRQPITPEKIMHYQSVVKQHMEKFYVTGDQV